MQKRVKAVAAALSLVLFNLGAAHATVVNQFFDFNNNQLPPGWGSLGPTVQNGRLLLSSGNTYAPIDTSKASSFSIDYDAGLGPNSGASAWLWGGGNATYNAGRLLLVNSNGATYIVGSSATATLSSGEARTVPVGSGEYHVSSTFANGQVSYSLRDLATGLGVSVNNAPAPYLTLAGVSGTSGIDKLFGFFSGQGTSWVDNVRVTITNNQPVSPPSTLTMAMLSDDVYNKRAATDQGYSTYKPLLSMVPPTLVPPIQTAGSTPQIPSHDETYGFKATAYLDTATNQIVIAVRGTSLNEAPLYNLLADASFDPDGPTNALLLKYVKELALLVQQVSSEHRGVPITLTGHSLGGAVAQIVGKLTGLGVTSFDAPGAASTLSTVQLHVPLLATLAGQQLTTPSSTITNYRLSGDQASFVGKDKYGPYGGQLGGTQSVVNPGSSHTSAWEDVLTHHDMTTLALQIRAYCPTSLVGQIGCTDGYTAENNIIGSIIRGVKTVCNTVLRASCSHVVVPVLANVALWIDPGPSTEYELELKVGSPAIRGLTLPTLTTVFGWSLKYHDQSGWSDFLTRMGAADFLFSTDVDGLNFIPLDINGMAVFNTDFFSYGIRFASNGTLSAIQTEIGAIPEPGTVALALLGLGALGFARRRLGAEKAKFAH